MENERKKVLGTENIQKLMLKLSIPSIVAQLVNVLYNVVDRMYIGHIPDVGAMALTGLGIAFPIIMIISAFSAFIGMGGAPLAAIQLGKGDREQAERILANGITVLFFFSIVLTGLFYALKEPLLYLFGASDDTVYYSDSYVSIYLLGTIFVQFSLGLNTFISAQG